MQEWHDTKAEPCPCEDETGGWQLVHAFGPVSREGRWSEELAVRCGGREAGVRWISWGIVLSFVWRVQDKR